MSPRRIVGDAIMGADITDIRTAIEQGDHDWANAAGLVHGWSPVHAHRLGDEFVAQLRAGTPREAAWVTAIAAVSAIGNADPRMN